MAIYNFVEDLAFSKVREILSKTGGAACMCDRCVDDMVAAAINGLPVITYSTSEGGIHREVQNLANDRLRVDLAMRCVRAVEAVSKKPRHNKPGI